MSKCCSINCSSMFWMLSEMHFIAFHRISEHFTEFQNKIKEFQKKSFAQQSVNQRGLTPLRRHQMSPNASPFRRAGHHQGARGHLTPLPLLAQAQAPASARKAGGRYPCTHVAVTAAGRTARRSVSLWDERHVVLVVLCSPCC